MKTKIPKSLQRQAGNMVIQTAIAVGVLALVQVGVTRYSTAKAYSAKGAAIGTQLDAIRGNLNSYITTYFSTLTSATPSVSGVANPMAPTLAELQSLGLPNTSTIGAPAGGGTYLTKLTLAPAGCSGAACNVRGAVWLNTPMLDTNGGVDLNVLGAAAGAANGSVGFSVPATPTMITSSAGWAESNPDTLNRAGILMATTGYDSSSFAALMRRDGSRSASANHNWGGFNLTNMGTAQAATMQASGNVTAGGSISAGGGVTAGGTVTGTTVTSNGEVYNNGWYRSRLNGTGWYSEPNNAGMYASDPNWVRSYADKGIYTGGQMQATSFQANGPITAIGVITSYAPRVNNANDWALIARDAWGTDNVNPGSGVGSAYVNDVFLRSANKWASEMANGGGWSIAPNCYGGRAFGPPGAVFLWSEMCQYGDCSQWSTIGPGGFTDISHWPYQSYSSQYVMLNSGNRWVAGASQSTCVPDTGGG